jgi:hypothetical protein
MFSLNGFVHMILDSVPHKIFWLAPFSYRGFSVNALFKRIAPSIVEDHPYWSYSIEALIIILALFLFVDSQRTTRRTTTYRSVTDIDEGPR